MQGDGDHPLSHCLEETKVEAELSWAKVEGWACAQGGRGLVTGGPVQYR